VLAQTTGYNVINLAALGTQTTVNTFTGESMLDMMVPQIPRTADVVVCQCGENDLNANNQDPTTSARVTLLTKAILMQAPKAKIVYVGVRCYVKCDKPVGVDAWDKVEKELAESYGTFVSPAPLAPTGPSAAFPDGGHPTPATARLMAASVASAISSLLERK
jgi:lysophospholipase L1-like esterase